MISNETTQQSPCKRHNEGVIFSQHVPLSVQSVHSIVESMIQKSQNSEEDADNKISDTLVKSVQLGAVLWSMTEKDATSSLAGVDKSCYVPVQVGANDISGANTSSSATNLTRKPKATMSEASKRLKTWSEWKKDLFAGKKPPTPEQWRVLDEIYQRTLHEQLEGRRDLCSKSTTEPLRLMIQGLPGSGKSQVIQWIRSLFQDVMGYVHGREFICLASMNTMAALIGGMTIHSWAEVPINNDIGSKMAAKKLDCPGAEFVLFFLLREIKK